MSTEKRRDELGKLLACLLVSRKGVSTMKDLERDYRENEGRNIPYREFGYLSSLDFFRSISNHIKLVPGSGEYLVYPVVSDKIKHVNDLVCRQRPAKRYTPARRRPSRYSHCFPPVPDPKPFVPNTVQKEIAKILTSSRSGVDKNYIAQCLDQAAEVAGPVDSNNVDEYLTGMPYTAVGKGTKVYPSRALSATPNIPTRHKIEEVDGFEIVMPGESEAQGESLPKNNNIRVMNEYPAGEEDMDDYYAGDDHVQPAFSNMDNNYVTSEKYQSQQLSATDIIGNTSRMSSAEFIHRTGTLYNQSQYHTFQKESNNNLEENCKNVKELQSYDEEDENNLNDEDYTFESDDDGSIDIINPRLKSRLQELIQKHPKGIWCANLLQTYLDEYKVPLDYVELGFESVSQLAANLPKVFHLHRQNSRGDFLLYDATKPLPSTAQKSESVGSNYIWRGECCDDEVDPLPTTLILETSRSLVPRDVISHGETVGQERIPDVCPGEECLEIYVVDVITPSLFWIQLRKKRSALRQLMASMHDFYESEGGNYLIPHIILEKGLNCVCTYENRWHRAIIKSVKPDGDVTLIFYDYGTTQSHPPDDLRFLVRRYSNLPAQAIACGLYNVKPINADAWTRGVSHEFYIKVAELALVAIVVKIDRENNSMLISLVDTQNETDEHINDWLVTNGLAESGFMVRSRPSNFVYRHYLACINHYYNIFVMNSKSAKKDKVNPQVSSNAIHRCKPEFTSSSKIKLRSASFAKNFMASHSKYKRDSEDSSSSNAETEIPNHQIISTPVAHLRVEGCSSTDLTALKVVDSALDSIGDHRFSKLFRYKSKAKNRQPNDNKNNKNVAETQLLHTCKQSKRVDVKQNENSGSTTLQSVEDFLQVTGDSDLGKTSETKIQGSVKHDADAGKLEFSGTFQSFYGGHGEMKPIDWSQIRNDMRVGQQTEDQKPRVVSQAIVESPAWKLYKEDTDESESYSLAGRCSKNLSRESLNRRMVSNVQKVTTVESVVKKMKKEKILPATDCFLNAVQSNKDHYYSSYGEKLWWSPEGNIQDKPGVITPLLRNRNKNITETDTDLSRISVSPEILNMLREKRLYYKQKYALLKNVGDPELHFIMKLDNAVDFGTVGISNPSTDKDLKPMISLENYICQSKLRPETSETRISTILDYINKKKKQNVTLISAKNFSADKSDIDRHKNNFETVASNSNSSDLSSSSKSLDNQLDLQKDFGTLCERGLQSRASNKNDVILESQKHAEIYNSVEKQDTYSDSISSENLQTVFKPEASEAQILELNRPAKKSCQTLPKDQKEISTVNTNTGSISTAIEFRSVAGCNRAEIKKSVKSSETIQNHSKFSENDEAASELDSDDLSCSSSNSENEIVKISLPRANFELIKNTEPSTVDNENISATLEASPSECYESSSELCEGDDKLLNASDNKQIENHVLQKKTEIFAPIVNDLHSLADTDEWEVNGEWTDFMKTGQYTTRIIRKLELEYNASQSVEIVEVDNSSEQDHVVNQDCLEHRDLAESDTNELCEKEYSECFDTSYGKNRESIDSIERFEFVSKKEFEKSGEESDQTDCSSSPNETLNINPKNKSVVKFTNSTGDQALQCSETVIEGSNDVRDDIRISKQTNQNTDLVTDSENTLQTRVITSKTKSMREMLNNFKSKQNLGRVNEGVKRFDNCLQSETNTTFVPFEPNINEHVEFQIKTSPKNVRSGEMYAKESFSNSDTLTDSDDTLSSSNSISLISNDISVSESNTESIRFVEIGKNCGTLLERCKIPNKESQMPFSDAIEFIEEQPIEPCAPLSLLSKIKEQQLSVKSPVIDIGVQNTTRLNIVTGSERNCSILNASSDSNSGSSRSLFDKIRSIYSNT